jgi:peptidoglycan/xylan/chitin deacetylase (PgdA/CDA1 family)
VGEGSNKAAESSNSLELSELGQLLALIEPVARRLEGGIVAGTELARLALPHGRSLTALTAPDGGVDYSPLSPEEAYRNFISEAWSVPARTRALPPPLLNAFYRTKRFVPRSAQLSARRVLMRWQGVPRFPQWPLDTSVSELLRFYAFCRLRSLDVEQAEFSWFWPEGFDAALVLSHDVEGDSGLRRVLELADLEQELGFRSAFNLGGWYTPDPGLLRELNDRGFEVGVHGLRHDRSLFVSREAFESQLPQLAELATRRGAVGFRSPSIHRVYEWMGELPFLYDCTFPNSDPWEPQPGGCCSVWPFFIGPVVELPYTLPQDHALFTLRGDRSPKLWIDVAGRIEREYGLIQLIAHPDDGYLGDPAKRGYYAEFLAAMAERKRVWNALPRDVAAWWRARADGADGPRGTVRIGDEPGEVTFEPGSS